jgi:hypothetical protein
MARIVRLALDALSGIGAHCVRTPDQSGPGAPVPI